jgi:hypothetical protein
MHAHKQHYRLFLHQDPFRLPQRPQPLPGEAVREHRHVHVDARAAQTDWAAAGTNGERAFSPVAVEATENLPFSSGFLRLRGKDSNLDYLIQSQASYR